MHIAVYTLDNKPDNNFLIIKDKDLAEVMDKLQKNGQNPKIKLYKTEEVRFEITYKNEIETRVKRVPVFKEL